MSTLTSESMQLGFRYRRGMVQHVILYSPVSCEEGERCVGDCVGNAVDVTSTLSKVSIQ